MKLDKVNQIPPGQRLQPQYLVAFRLQMHRPGQRIAVELLRAPIPPAGDQKWQAENQEEIGDRGLETCLERSRRIRDLS